jgi:hypothetical protein
MADIVKLSRRDFVALSAVGGAGLAIGAYLPGQGNKSGAAALQPGAFVRIDPDDSITIWMARPMLHPSSVAASSSSFGSPMKN